MYVTQGDPKSSMVEMYHSRIDELNQENIVIDLAKADGNIRILISTIAYGMGVNCQGVRTIIHYGPSRNIVTGKGSFFLTVLIYYRYPSV